jgi:hypothetical protein
MADSASPGFVSRWRDGMAAVRETAVLALIVVFVLFPSVLHNQLHKMKVEKFDFAGFTLAVAEGKVATQQIAGQLIRDSVKVESIVDSLRALQATSPPQVRAQLDSMATRLERTQGTTASLERSLRRSIAVQDSFLANVAPSQVAQEGWIFAGRVKPPGTEWDTSSERVVAAPPAQVLPGNQVQLTTDVYLRADSKPLEHANAPILGVLAGGTTVAVIGRDSSHARRGGWFIWAKVQRGTT